MADPGTYDNNMPSTYDSSHTSGGTGQSGGGVQVSMDFLRSANGILQIVQAVSKRVALNVKKTSF